MLRIGIDLGGTKIEGIVMDETGTILETRRVAAPQGRYDDTLIAVRDLVLGLEGESRDRCSVGIGMPGSTSKATGLIQNANSTWLNGRSFATDMGAVLSREVRVANDANCFTLSEAVDGAATDADLVFGVILGTGVGGGIVCNRSLWTGRHGIAGEWGHNELPRRTEDDFPEVACYCGRSGCIETYLSGPNLARGYAHGGGGRIDAPEVVRRARTGEDLAVETMRRFYLRLARALASVINLLDPDLIVLGGGLSNIEELYTELPALLPALTFSDHVDTPIVRNRHGDSSGVRGAARLW